MEKYVVLYARLLVWLYRSRADAARQASMRFRWAMWRERRRAEVT